MKRLAIMMALMGVAPAMAQDEPALKPTPIGNPGAWIPMDAYPPAAKASAEEGRVAFTLDVDNAGHVNECKITKSSDSPLLDETTCNLMTANGRFTPPKDKKGKPVASKWSSAVTWKLAVTPATPEPVAPGQPAVAPAPASKKR
jgi:TonB family protein